MFHTPLNVTPHIMRSLGFLFEPPEQKQKNQQHARCKDGVQLGALDGTRFNVLNQAHRQGLDGYSLSGTIVRPLPAYDSAALLTVEC